MNADPNKLSDTARSALYRIQLRNDIRRADILHGVPESDWQLHMRQKRERVENVQKLRAA